MTHPNLELMSMLIEEEKRRVKAISTPAELPLRPGPMRRAIGKALVSLGEQIGGQHLRRNPAPISSSYPTAKLA